MNLWSLPLCVQVDPMFTMPAPPAPGHPGAPGSSLPSAPSFSSPALPTSNPKQLVVRTRSIGTNTQDGGISGTLEGDSACLGPCQPGTSVNLEGIVWHETEEGKELLSMQWWMKYSIISVCQSTASTASTARATVSWQMLMQFLFFLSLFLAQKHKQILHILICPLLLKCCFFIFFCFKELNNSFSVSKGFSIAALSVTELWSAFSSCWKLCQKKLVYHNRVINLTG